MTSSPAMDLAAWFLVDQKVSRSENHIDHLRDGIDFHRTEILNHRVQAAGTLRCGDLMEGILLAESFDANPTGFADNSLVPICLSIVNQFGDVHKSTTRARLKRIAERIQLTASAPDQSIRTADGASGSPDRLLDIPDALALHNSQPEALGR